MNIHVFLGTFLDRSSGRILLQLKKTLTKKMVEVKFETMTYKFSGDTFKIGQTYPMH